MTDFDTKFPLLRVLGGWGVVNGPGLFMIRSIVAGVSHATIVGVSGAIIGSVVWGTASIPFILASTIGFALGSWRWYQTAIYEASSQLEKHPALMRLHIQANFPWKPDMCSKGLEWYTVARFRSSWVFESMLVASWLSAVPALEEVRSRKEARIVEMYVDEE